MPWCGQSVPWFGQSVPWFGQSVPWFGQSAVVRPECAVVRPECAVVVEIRLPTGHLLFLLKIYIFLLADSGCAARICGSSGRPIYAKDESHGHYLLMQMYWFHFRLVGKCIVYGKYEHHVA